MIHIGTNGRTEGSPWRAVLRVRSSGRPLPLLVGDDGSIATAASLWSGVRRWLAAFRAAGIARGDRVVCALPEGPAFVHLLVATLWDGLTLVPVRAADDVDAAIEALDARLGVGTRPGAGIAVPDATGGPPHSLPALSPAGAPTPDARFLLRTSGTSGQPRWVALSDENVRAVLDSHGPFLADEGARVLSLLPWHHAFGLVLDLLPALLGGAAIIRAPGGGRDPAAALRVGRGHHVTHCSAVPYVVERIARERGGESLLRRLVGGVVGGAPVDARLVDVLRGTRLRAGYGQTEASPGIALGEPGEWDTCWLGRPLGCEVRRDDDGVLAFRGPNAALGEWRDGTLHRLDANRWAHTGDLVRIDGDGGLWFEGRAAETIKLANGRFVHARAVERAVLARWPALTDALLSSPDGERLVLALSAEEPAALPDAADVRPLLGALASRPCAVVRVPPHAWVRTTKGELDRRHPTGRTALA